MEKERRTVDRRKPEWLRINLPKVNEYAYLKQKLEKYHLHTICESGICPNIGECWKNKTDRKSVV